jgi:hypothetical protein
VLDTDTTLTQNKELWKKVYNKKPIYKIIVRLPSQLED